MSGEHEFEQSRIKSQGLLVKILGWELSITIRTYVFFAVFQRTDPLESPSTLILGMFTSPA
jgi:hypothetical protein